MKNYILLLITLFTALTVNAGWVKTSAFDGGYIYSLTAVGDTVYAATRKGVFVTTDEGAHWVQKNSGLTTYLELEVNSIAVSDKYMFAATDGGVFLSTNKAESWSLAIPKVGNVTLSADAIAIKDGIVIAGTGAEGVYISKDNGNSWAPSNSGLPEGFGVKTIAVTNKYIYVGDSDEGVFRSSDNGKTWSVINNGLPDEYRSIFTLTADGENIFLGTYGKGIFLLEDKKTSWKEINNGLTRKYFQSILVKGQNVIAASYGGGSGGVYQSTDYGENWKAINYGLSEWKMTALCMTSENVFIGDRYGRVFKQAASTLITAAEEHTLDRSNLISLKQNFPNPFSNSTTIEYRIPFSLKSTHITLNVYDINGNQICTLVNENKEPGNYKTYFNGAKLSSGVYFYKLSSDNRVIAQKQMVLSK